MTFIHIPTRADPESDNSMSVGDLMGIADSKSRDPTGYQGGILVAPNGEMIRLDGERALNTMGNSRIDSENARMTNDWKDRNPVGTRKPSPKPELIKKHDSTYNINNFSGNSGMKPIVREREVIGTWETK